MSDFSPTPGYPAPQGSPQFPPRKRLSTASGTISFSANAESTTGNFKEHHQAHCLDFSCLRPSCGRSLLRLAIFNSGSISDSNPGITIIERNYLF